MSVKRLPPFQVEGRGEFILLNLAETYTANVTNATIETELMGIRMAETMGERFPVTAKLRPTMLYKKDSPMLIKTIRMAVWLKRRNQGRFRNCPDSRMASHAGEK